MLSTLDKLAPLKQKVVRGNDQPFMTKEIRKAIFNRSKFKNTYNKSGLEIDLARYKKQRNFVCSLVRKEKKSFFSNIDINPEKRNFWQACKPYLVNKCILSNEKITLRNNEKVVSNEQEVANLFNNYFSNILSTLNISYWNPDLSVVEVFNHPNIFYPKYYNHPSISKIRETFKHDDLFYFNHVSATHIYNIIIDLKKGSGEIPIGILKSINTSCSSYLADCINTSISNCYFPKELKWADIIPVFKKGEVCNKENYRPISILPTVSKVFERVIFDQINKFMEDKFSSLLCGFRKGFSTQTALIKLLQRWQKCLDNKGIVGTVLIDLSKAYDCIQHDLLLAKLEAYGFSKRAISFLNSYLKGRKQRVKIGSAFSKWLEVNFGIPHGSILGPLLFNIFINDIFLFIKMSDICNFADDNTLYVCDNTIEKVMEKLKIDLLNLNKWFSDNSLVANPSKFQLMFLGTKDYNNLSLDIDNSTVSATVEVELLGITIDNKLSFSSHIKKICKNANNKLCAIIRLRNYLSLSQTKLLINSYVLSNFSYCPLLWMFCQKKDMLLINK